MVGVSLFFQYFGILSFILMIILIVMCNKELKKQLPSDDEKKQLIQYKLINENEKNKKVLRQATARLRQEKMFADYCRKNGYHK